MMRLFTISLIGLFVSALVGIAMILYAFWYYGQDLPDYRQLGDYEPPVMSRIHAGDGSLIGVYARQKRIFVPREAIPDRVVGAFLSAEDKTFYQHGGIDVTGLARAVVVNVLNVFTGRRPVGASTITQQVAKNFLLTSEVSYTRKIKEAILALRIERAFSKDQIIELYLNEIYMGRSAYGIAAASLIYFNKALDELTVADVAYLAALPKAPNNYHPIRNHDRAIARRNWVIGQMFENGYITDEERDIALAQPLNAGTGEAVRLVNANYFTSSIAQDLIGQYGEDSLFEGGLSIRTTVEPELQRYAHQALRDGLESFDRRWGWRGAIETVDSATLEDEEGLETTRLHLADLDERLDFQPWQHAVVTKMNSKAVKIMIADGGNGIIPMAEIEWARRAPVDGKGGLGPKPTQPSDVLTIGDIVLVERTKTDADGRTSYALKQEPEVNGGIVAMDPHTGRVLALVGGYSYARSRFNRATQANRQPGSAFKPIVYAAGLDVGFTPSSLVLDAPFVMDQGPGKPMWKPGNYSNKFYGPSTLRLGIEKSRNLMTVRLAQYIGMDAVVTYAKLFGIGRRMPKVLSASLGSQEVHLIDMVNAYSIFVNGGKRVSPVLIDRVQDRRGKTVFKSDKRECANCFVEEWDGTAPPQLPDTRKQIINSATAYQIVSMLEGAVQRGTGFRAKAVNKPLAGKTGTTNDSNDAWFVGFSPDLAVGVYVGYDTPRSLGRSETGSSAASPIFTQFMQDALKNKPATPFRIPPTIRLVRVNGKTGKAALPGDQNVILEAFKLGTGPDTEATVLDGTYRGGGADNSSMSGTGGLY